MASFAGIRYTHHVMSRVWTDWIHWIKGLIWITEKVLVVHKCKCPRLSQLHIKTFHLFADDIMFILKFKSYFTIDHELWEYIFSTHPREIIHQDMCPTCWSGQDVHSWRRMKSHGDRWKIHQFSIGDTST